MAEITGSTVEKTKGDLLINLRSKMREGKFNEAKQLERESIIQPHIVSTIANSVFDTLMKERECLRALELARIFNLSPDKISDAVLQHYRALESKNEYEKAIEWGRNNGLPILEITRAAVKWIEYLILQGDVRNAVEVKSKYNVEHDQIGALWQRGYDVAFQENRFFDAALLCREFGSSERKTMLTAAKALKKAIIDNDKDQIIAIDREFRFFNEDNFSLLGDDESKSISSAFQNYLRSKFRKGESSDVLKTIDSVQLLYNIYSNHHLKGLVAFIYKEAGGAHGILLDMDRYDDAKYLFDEIDFNQEKIPLNLKQKVIEQAVNYHNKVLMKGNLDAAKKTKDEYDLLGTYSPAETINSVQDTVGKYLSECFRRGELKKSTYLIEEYNIPKSEVFDAVTENIIALLEDEKYKVVFDLVLSYKVNTLDMDIQTSAKNAFDMCMEKGHYEVAADLGHVFELNDSRVKDAALIVWERLMEAEDYQKARVTKRKHKLPRKVTQKIAKTAYNSNIDRNKTAVAKKIREEYGISIGALAWLMEIIKSILRLFGFS